MYEFFLQIFTETGFTLLRYFVIAGVAFVLFYKIFAHRFANNKIQVKQAGKADFLREVLHSSISSICLAATALLAFSGWVRPYTMIYTHYNDFPIWYIPLSVFLALIVHDTYFYWMHRVLHHKKLFNLTHLVHHRSTNPSPFTAYSFHVLEAIAEGWVILVIVFVMPMHPLSITLFALSSLLINVYGHLGYEIMPKGFRKSWLFHVLNTSTFHNLHHQKFKGNYGLYFRWWDRWMKTEHPSYVEQYDRLQAKRFGHKKEKL
ncbi:sterol desaturase/sphingolipid hydroxylase (fatty acid hydroxylase superfamily) [Chitinophaga skermanii]|uniref:Sterol desaturase/sphingolipid hydroxylase (Fatty acid hydroxylase superfamily) n=1 Tax=Chitinophaga skermanii TaxID=331697 RepID=A0A327QXQ0_9BACT|nr:sterol desaturase family protein [Chitinophaga skermanii]RAJ08745.1 sterol desaturase/sphingolipid hydroxylase (fatty acid hydroxylase superfamily) [Chitinophaga skermanii]